MLSVEEVANKLSSEQTYPPPALRPLVRSCVAVQFQAYVTP